MVVDAILKPVGSLMAVSRFLWAKRGAHAAVSIRTVTGPWCSLCTCMGGGGIGVSKPSPDGRALTCPVGDPRRTWGECPVCCWLVPPRW